MPQPFKPIALGIIGCLMAPPAGATVEPLSLPEKKTAEKPAYRITGSLKSQIISEDNHDLGTRSDRAETGLINEARLGVHFYPARSVRLYVEGRGLYNTGLTRLRNDEGEQEPGSSYGELRQAWVRFDRIMDRPRLMATVGRQRLREESGLWWNRDMDAVKIDITGGQASAFIATAQNIDNYRWGEDDDFRAEDQDRLRLLGAITWPLNDGHRLELRGAYERDYSGEMQPGSIVDDEDRDDEDATLFWSGLRGTGRVNTTSMRLDYRLDGMAVTGKETLSDTVAGPGGGQRTVTGTRRRNVQGWAFDGHADIAVKNWPLHPVFSLGYAFASGDDSSTGAGTDHAFRQTGLHANSGRPLYDDSQYPLRSYGEVLRPELSNLHILSLGVQIPFMDFSHISLRHYAYWLDEKNGGLRQAGITAPLSGRDNFIGQAMDMAVEIPVGREMGWSSAAAENVTSRFILGTFRAGDAYGPAEDEQAWRALMELRLRF